MDRETCGSADAGSARPTGAYGPVWEEFGPRYYSGPHFAQDDEGWSAPKVAQALDVSEGTVFRLKRRFAEYGLEGPLKDRLQAHRYRKLDHLGEAHLIALACSPAPEGHEHWNLRLLANRMVELGVVESLSHEAVRLHLKKTSSSRGRRSSGASPR